MSNYYDGREFANAGPLEPWMDVDRDQVDFQPHSHRVNIKSPVSISPPIVAYPRRPTVEMAQEMWIDEELTAVEFEQTLELAMGLGDDDGVPP